jgi:hypothetical protein
MSPGSREPQWFRSVVDLPYDDRTWRSIRALATRPWFKRLWVVQEIQLANDGAIVQCGSSVVQWKWFRRALLALVEKQSLPSHDFKTALDPVYHIVCGLSARTPLTILSANRIRECKDAHDKVYGTLSLLPAELRQQIPVDYKLSVPNLYKTVVLICLKSLDLLNFLTYCTSDTALAGAPSWVPNWSAGSYSRDWPEACWRASGNSTGNILYNESDGNHLKVWGVECGTVREVSVPLAERPRAAQAVLRSFQPAKVASDSETYVDGRSMLDAYVGFLAMSLFSERFPIVGGYKSFSRWRDVTKEWLSKNSPDSDESLAALMQGSWQAFTGRSLLSLQSGYFGYGPSAAEQGNPSPFIHAMDDADMLMWLRRPCLCHFGLQTSIGPSEGDGRGVSCGGRVLHRRTNGWRSSFRCAARPLDNGVHAHTG